MSTSYPIWALAEPGTFRKNRTTLPFKALADLTRKNNLSGTVRTEAQDLAKLLRNSLGEEVLVPASRPAPCSRKASCASTCRPPSAMPW